MPATNSTSFFCAEIGKTGLITAVRIPRCSVAVSRRHRLSSGSGTALISMVAGIKTLWSGPTTIRQKWDMSHPTDNTQKQTRELWLQTIIMALIASLLISGTGSARPERTLGLAREKAVMETKLGWWRYSLQPCHCYRKVMAVFLHHRPEISRKHGLKNWKQPCRKYQH